MDTKRFQEGVGAILSHLTQPNLDVVWSSFDSAEQVVEMLRDIEPRILVGDEEAIATMKLLLAPTGSLQEISMG